MHTISNSDPDLVVQGALDALRRQGRRITEPRRQVIAVLAGTSEHLTVEDVYERVAEQVDGIHLATIYRTVEALIEAGLIDHVHLPHGATTYHLVVDDHASHCHVMCTGCDRVLDIPAGALDGVAAELLNQHGFQLNAHHVALTGRCASCLPAATPGE